MNTTICDSKKLDYATALYHREYSHDIPPQKDLISRIALATAPFLALLPMMKLPVALTMDTVRAVNSTGLQRWGAITSIAITVLNFQIGAAITTIADIILEIQALRSSHDRWDAFQHLIKISNNLIYLALRTTGGMELYLISCALNTSISLLSSIKEFKKERWIEGTAHLLMSAVRLHQMYEPWTQLNLNSRIEKCAKKWISRLKKDTPISDREISASVMDQMHQRTKLVSEIFMKRHSGENFDDRPLNKDQIDALIEATRRTPSSYNDQPWNFILCNRDTHEEAYKKVVDSIYGQEWAEKAPLLVVSVVRPEFRYNQKENPWAGYDTGAAALSMCLQATDLGLMAHEIGGFSPEMIQESFNLPKGYQPVTIIAIGYEEKSSHPIEEAPSERLPIDYNFFFGGWGASHAQK